MGNGDQDARFRFRTDDVHEGVHARGGASAEEDAAWVGRIFISALDESSHAISYARGTLALAVCAYGLDLVNQPFRAVKDVLFVAEGGFEGFWVFQ